MPTMGQILDKYEEAGIGLYQWKTPCEAVTVEVGGDYAVFIDFFQCTSTAEIMWKLIHEYGHADTGATHNLSSPHQLREQHEFKANKRGAFTFLPPEDFEEAFQFGCHDIWELAEWFNLPEEKVYRTWSYYKDNGLLTNGSHCE